MTGPDPDEARRLLDEADRAGSTARAGASWTAVALLMAIGAGSSAALIGMWFAPTDLLWLPMSTFFLWLAIGLVFHRRFSTSSKRGFSRRWLITMAAWAVVWTVAVFTTSRGAIGDNVVWVTVMAIALTAVTAVGAWREAAA